MLSTRLRESQLWQWELFPIDIFSHLGFPMPSSKRIFGLLITENNYITRPVLKAGSSKQCTYVEIIDLYNSFNQVKLSVYELR